ncbi:MAG: YkgJ family cysteine cluster protein [Desulfohalobiaceae bacterium]
MDLQNKIQQLQEIYQEYQHKAAGYKANAVCVAGCAYCCTHYGHLDMTTLEGLRIQFWLQELPGGEREEIQQRITANLRDKEQQKPSVCPFLGQDSLCRIYEVRPFVCRHLYSLQQCGEQGPVVHSGAMQLARSTIQRIHKLDSTGYSGHMSFILALLERKGFLGLYKAGGFDPGRIKGFGKGHGLIINMTAAQGGFTSGKGQ